MNTHCHPFRPAWPSIVLCIAVIIRPANILPTWPTAVKTAARLAISDGVLPCCQSLAPQGLSIGLNLLPRPEDIHCAAIQTSLHGSLEESHRSNLLVRCACGGAHGDARPQHKSQWKPDAGPDLLQDKRVGDQRNHVASEVSELGLSTQLI